MSKLTPTINARRPAFFNMNKLYIVIAALFLCATANAQWQKQTVSTTAGFRGLDVVSEKIVWASGTEGTVIKTVDGGATWNVINVKGAEKLDFRDIEAFDANTAYVLSIGSGKNSRIYKTIDGGMNWDLQFTNVNEKAFFDSIAFWDENHGIAQSDPVDGKYLFFATDDGKSWKELSTNNMPPAKKGEAAFAASGTCIVTRGLSELFLVSGGTDARVFYSGDRGLTWSVADTPIARGGNGTGIFSIALSAQKGVIVGGDYTKPQQNSANIAYSNDGGRTWAERQQLNPFGYRSGVTFVDEKTLIVVGTGGSDISQDGGKTWKAIDREIYNAVNSLGKRAIWAVGPNGRVARYTLK